MNPPPWKNLPTKEYHKKKRKMDENPYLKNSTGKKQLTKLPIDACSEPSLVGETPHQMTEYFTAALTPLLSDLRVKETTLRDEIKQLVD